jgi:speckle-type POZ protein
MFRNKFKESEENIVKIDEADHRLFKEILKFIYTKEIIDMEHNDTLEVLRLANKYAVDNLIHVCQKKLTKSLNTCNSIDLLLAADANQLIDLKKIIIDYMAANINQIMSSREWIALKKDRPQLVIEVTSQAISKK